MNRLRFQFYTLTNGDMLLSFPPLFRYGLGGMAMVVAISLIINGTVSTGGLFFIFLCSAGSLYIERWNFSPNKKYVSHERGFVPFARKEIFQIDTIENLTLHRGQMQNGARFQALSFDTTENQRIIVDTRGDVSWEDWAWQLSKGCQIPLGFEGIEPQETTEKTN